MINGSYHGGIASGFHHVSDGQSYKPINLGLINPRPYYGFSDFLFIYCYFKISVAIYVNLQVNHG